LYYSDLHTPRIPDPLVYKCYVAHRDLHSFPTRRSSDLQPDEENGEGKGFSIRDDKVKDPEEELLYSETVKELAEKIKLLNEKEQDRKSTRLNSSHVKISYAVFCLKKKKK